jgi:anti-sigma-K factor RskA
VIVYVRNNVECADRRDLILLYAAGVLDAAEAAELRRHLAAGCPQCAGYLAEAQATVAHLPLQLEPRQPAPLLKQTILNRARTHGTSGESVPMRIGGWDRIVLPAAIAAVLAVAVTLLVVKQFRPASVRSAEDQKTIADLQGQLHLVEDQLAQVPRSLRDMKFAELTGDAQPAAVGHVFLDPAMNNWYFFTCGMKPAPDGRTYELWLIHDGQKIPAGTFAVNQNGTAMLLGTIPPLPGGAGVTLAVTDEPANGPHQVPTGHLQIKGDIE